MMKMRRSSQGRRLFLLGICIILTVSLCKEQVLADANYRIKLNSAVENAVFSLSYTGEVDSLTIVSPTGVSYDSAACGTAYRKETGKIRIGVLYADAGSWQVIITGAPDDGFRLLILSDPDYGEYAGIRPPEEENPVPPETTTPPETTVPPPSSTPETESPEPEHEPGLSSTAPAISEVRTQSNTGPVSPVISAVPSGQNVSGVASREDETVTGRTASESGSPKYPESSEGTILAASSIPGAVTVDETSQIFTEGTAGILVTDNSDASKEPSPVPVMFTGTTEDSEGAVLFASAAVTLSVIVIAFGKIVRGVSKKTPRIQLQTRNKANEQVDFRDYFPEEK